MKFFLDTADIAEIKQGVAIGVIEGVTTNPSLIAKSGRKFEEVVKEITQLVDGPISAEVISLEAEQMIAEAEPLTKLHKNIVIKIPMTAEGIKAVSALSQRGIKTNVTLVFTPQQALLAAKAGATYVSPFVGRLDDAGEDGCRIISEIIKIYQNYGFTTQVITASIRTIEHVRRAALSGSHIATIPYKVFEELFKHPLTEAGIKKFLSDWEKVPQ